MEIFYVENLVGVVMNFKGYKKFKYIKYSTDIAVNMNSYTLKTAVIF